MRQALSLLALIVVGVMAGVGLGVRAAPGQPAPPSGQAAIEVLRVQGNVYMIAGAGSNMAVQVGPDGVVVVDTGSGQRNADVLAAIKTLSDQPIRFLINTGGDPDHVGGNAALASVGRSAGGRGGPAIVGHERILTRMSASSGRQSIVPESAWPTQTFLDKEAMYLNGEGIQITHQPAAHSDSDSITFFRRSDVIAVGDILDTTRFPVIDVAHGGSIEGEIAALNRLIDLTIPPTPLVWQDGGTKVIPGHGHIEEQADVVEYRDMVTIIRDVIQDMIKRGMTLDQIKAASPAKPYTGHYGSTSGSWTTDMFVEAIYASLTAKKP